MKLLRILLAITWEIPQTLLGLLLLLMTHGYGRKNDKLEYASVFWRVVKWGVSLGPIIILGKLYDINFDKEKEIQVEKHEHGHTVQSMIFGPFYLLVIGLPSIFFNILTRFKVLSLNSYYTRYPENWADKLGKVKR